MMVLFLIMVNNSGLTALIMSRMRHLACI